MPSKKSKGSGSSRILSKPKAMIQKKDILKELKKPTDYKMVKDERVDDTEYNQSYFFGEEFRHEQQEGVKWLS